MKRFSLATLIVMSLLSGYFLYLNMQPHRMTVYVMDGSEIGPENNIGQPELAVAAYGWPYFFDYTFLQPHHYDGFLNPQEIVDRRWVGTLIYNVLSCLVLCVVVGVVMEGALWFLYSKKRLLILFAPLDHRRPRELGRVEK